MGNLYKLACSFENSWKESTDKTGKDYRLSVILPVYRSKYLEDMIKHLNEIGKIHEIIVVDDSGDNDENFLKNIRNSSNITVLQHKKNLGLSAARNTGAIRATGDVLVFTDSDMFLAPDFLDKARSVLASNRGHAMALGLRDTIPFENIPKLSSWVSPELIKDWRRKTTVENNLIDITASGVGSLNNKCKAGETLDIYNQSNKLRNLGVAPDRTIGFWDLPSIVIGHSMVISKDDFIKNGGFPEWIKGWGGEDIVFGFLAVANQLPIVLTDAVSCHVQHPPLKVSREQQFIELAGNIANYREWVHSVSKFPVCNTTEWLMRGKVLPKQNNKSVKNRETFSGK